MLVNKLVVIGVGLIGGSLAAAAKAAGICREVIGINRRQQACEDAVRAGIVDRAYTAVDSVASELGEGDVIFIAVPTLAVPQIFQQLCNSVPDAVTITDGASVKGSVLKALRRVYGKVPAQVVLGHPIAGSEKSGLEAVDAQLYRHHRVILTPVAETGNDHVQRVQRLWEAVGAEVLHMSVEEHDEVLAATSHLPHVIAYSLVDTLANDAENENIFRYAAGGFRDFTRIASSDPTMWHDVMRTNRAAILGALDLFTSNLHSLRTAIENEDSEYLLGVFTRAKSARDHFIKILSKKAYIEPMQNRLINYRVKPSDKLTGIIRVPGDKSISHRAVMLGSLAEGVTEIKDFLEGEDALATLQAFRDMGVVIEGPDQGRLKIHGVGLHGLKAPPGPLYLGNSGTSMRLLCGLLAGQAFNTELVGDESLSQRPMNRVADPLREMGAVILTGEEKGLPPIRIRGGNRLTGIDYPMPMASAQVKSSVLLAGLYAQGTTQVTEPAPTRDHTERMLAGFGYPIECAKADSAEGGSRVTLQGGGKLKATTIKVPADISSAAFFMVGAAIAPGSDITLTHVGHNPTRTGVMAILRLMGADLTLSNERTVGGESVADIRVRYAPLKGIEIPVELVPLAIDEFPVLFVAAACADGKTVLSGAEELRVKESDRILVMAQGLQTLGIDAVPTSDGIEIVGGQIQQGEVDSHGDHRIAMAFTMVALRAQGQITIRDCANVATSFPGFAELAQQAGINVEVYDTTA